MSENKGKEKIITLIAGIILAVIAVVVVVAIMINSTDEIDSGSDSGFDISFGSKTNDVSDLYGMSKEEVEKICGKPEEQLDEGEQRSFAIYGDNNITYNNGFVESITVYSSDFLTKSTYSLLMFLIATLASSPIALTSFANSLRLS